MSKALLGPAIAAALAAGISVSAAQTVIIDQGSVAQPSVVFTPEQSTVIHRRIIEVAPPPPPPGIAIEVGASIPAEIELAPVPVELVAEIPSVESYNYVVVQDEIVFVDPVTRRVVAVVQR